MSSDYSIKKIREEFKSKGVFYTPPELTSYILSLVKKQNFKTAYDPTCGRGNLLSALPENVEKYGQDIDEKAVEYCRNNIPNFKGAVGSTLDTDGFKGMKFDLILANPPFSIKYNPDGLENDERFKQLPCLAPPSKADFMFVADILYKLKDDGEAIIIEFPGILYRGAKEAELRKWIIEKNYIDTIIQIPPNQFTDTTISTVALILRKNKTTTDVKFIDLECEIEKMATIELIRENDYNLSVSSYCEKPDTREKIEITTLNKQLKNTRKNINKCSREIDNLIAEIEGGGKLNDNQPKLFK